MKRYAEFDEFDVISPQSQSQPIDLKPYFQVIVKNWKKILVWAVCGCVIGIIIGFSKPKTFTSTAVAAPELATRSTLSSGLNSLASLAGVNMNSLAITDAMHPDLYPVVISSRDFCIGLFDVPVSFTHADTLVQTDLYDYVLNYTKVPWYGYVLSFPGIALGTVKGWFEKDAEEELEGYSTIDPLQLTKQQEAVVKAISKSISAGVEKKTYVLSVQATFQDRMVAAQVANAVVDHLRSFVVKYRCDKAMDNVDYYEKLAEQTHEEYMQAQRAYAKYLDSNRGEQTSSAQVQRQLLQNEAQLKYQIYNSAAQNLLSARAKVQQEAPVLVVVQSAMAPKNGSPSKKKLALIWFIIGAALCYVWLIWKKEPTNEEEKQ